MIDAPRNIPQELPMNTMELVDDIVIHHDAALSLLHLLGLIGGSIGYDQDREVALNVIEREIHDAAASMKALAEKICGCLDEEVRP
jgi:hypothetical protein